MRKGDSGVGTGTPLPRWALLVGWALAIGAMVLWQLGIAWPFFLFAIACPAVPLVMRDVAARRRRREARTTAVS